MTGAFAQATAATADGPGHWSAEQVDGWDIHGNANGGVVLATAARAMAKEADRPDPVSVTAHYLRPIKTGPLTVETETLKAGRRLVTVSGRLLQGGQLALQLLGTFGDITAIDGPQLVVNDRPSYPPPDACISTYAPQGFAPGLMSKIDVRLVPEDALFATERSTGLAQMRGWFRLHDAEPIDVFASLLAIDAFPPAIFNTSLPNGWAPTVELTAHTRRRPRSEWLQVRVRSRYIFGGFLEEDTEVWDDDGLVALGRQLALVPL
jgi:acyl-CoA thioesterase